jgi:hypothetical protein
MPKPSPLLVAAVCGMCTALALAQEASPSDAPSIAAPGAEKKTAKAETPKPASHSTAEKPAAKPTPQPESLVPIQAPTAEAVATPKPKKPGFFQRLFGSRKKKDATAATTPEPTASPTPAGRRVVRHAAATPTPKPDDSTTSKPDKIANQTRSPPVLRRRKLPKRPRRQSQTPQRPLR